MNLFEKDGQKDFSLKFRKKAIHIIDKTVKLSDKGFYEFYSSIDCENLCQGPCDFT